VRTASFSFDVDSGTFRQPAGFVSAVANQPTRAMQMDKSLTVSLWLGVALYAALGLVGVVALHEGAPSFQNLSGGYGVVYSALASSESVK
jgi:hypothetical protein